MSTSFEPGVTPAGFIPLCVPELRGNEWKYVKDCLDTGWVSSVGPFVDRFEKEFARRAETKYAIATVNGTAAIHIALLIAGVMPDDEVLVSTLTFIAPVNAIRYVGAYPVFIDAEPAYLQLDVEKIAGFIEHQCDWRNGELRNKKTRRRVRAILPVHVLGHPVDMDPLLELSHKYNLSIIEDATEGLGARYKGRHVGSLGVAGCFSFNGNKIITTGGGGMLVTGSAELAAKAKYLTTQAKDDPIEYIHGEIGYNYRLTNIQAAIGCAQLEVLDQYIDAKRRIAQAYNRGLANIAGLTLPKQAPWAGSIWWMYTMLVDALEYGEDSRALLNRLNQNKIQTRPLWQPAHKSPAHRDCESYHCEVAERLNRDGLSLPCSVGLTESQREHVLVNVCRK